MEIKIENENISTTSIFLCCTCIFNELPVIKIITGYSSYRAADRQQLEWQLSLLSS